MVVAVAVGTVEAPRQALRVIELCQSDVNRCVSRRSGLGSGSLEVLGGEIVSDVAHHRTLARRWWAYRVRRRPVAIEVGEDGPVTAGRLGQVQLVEDAADAFLTDKGLATGGIAAVAISEGERIGLAQSGYRRGSRVPGESS